MEPASICSTHTSCLASSSDCTGAKTTRAPGWAWPSSNGSCTGTTAASGPRRMSTKERHSFSHLAVNGPRKRWRRRTLMVTKDDKYDDDDDGYQPRKAPLCGDRSGG